MAKKPSLPIEVHDHFRKANILHGYVEKSLGEATTHALETGKELLAAKTTIPHGGWEDACKRLFGASLRTAQFYMTFARDVTALPKAQASSLLLLEGTLDGAAKAARKAVKPQKPKPPVSPPEPPEDDSPENTSEANEAFATAAQESESPPKSNGKPPKQIERSAWFKTWTQSIGPLIRQVTRIAEGVGEKHGKQHKAIRVHLDKATDIMEIWMREKQ